MVAPGSPVPVTTIPVASIAAVGAAGAVRSGAGAETVGEALLAASAWPTVSVPPSVCGADRRTT